MRSGSAACLVALSFVAVSCGGGSDPVADPVASGPPIESMAPTEDVTATLPADLIGLFKTVVTLDDLKRLNDPHFDHHPEELTGTQYLEIRSDGTYVFYEDRPERPVIRGLIEADETQLTFTDEVAAIPGFIPCPRSGTYAWERDGDKLVFENVNDSCLKLGRIAIMTASPFREA